MPDPSIQKVLAFDFGMRRVGVALGITITETASPLDTIDYQNKDQLWSKIDTLIAEWRPQHLLLGLPNLNSGAEHDLEKPIRKFANQLQSRYQLTVELIDESNTSVEATNRLKFQRQQGRRKRIDKKEIDRQAAALLVENWLACG